MWFSNDFGKRRSVLVKKLNGTFLLRSSWLIMADGYRYMPQTKVQWTSSQAYSQFRLRRKEVERIINGPMLRDEESVKMNTVYIWAGVHVETLVEARKSEDPELTTETVSQLVDCV